MSTHTSPLNPGVALRAALGPGLQVGGISESLLRNVMANQAVRPVDSHAVAIPRFPASA